MWAQWPDTMKSREVATWQTEILGAWQLKFWKLGRDIDQLVEDKNESLHYPLHFLRRLRSARYLPAVGVAGVWGGQSHCSQSCWVVQLLQGGPSCYAGVEARCRVLMTLHSVVLFADCCRRLPVLRRWGVLLCCGCWGYWSLRCWVAGIDCCGIEVLLEMEVSRVWVLLVVVAGVAAAGHECCCYESAQGCCSLLTAHGWSLLLTASQHKVVGDQSQHKAVHSTRLLVTAASQHKVAAHYCESPQGC